METFTDGGNTVRPDDRYLIYKCLNDDSAAFGILVDKYKAGVYALAYSRLRNFHDAEDVAQEAFVKAYQKLRTLKYWDDFPAWLYSITSNLCKNWIRAQSTRRDLEFVADQASGVAGHSSIDSHSEDPTYESLHEALNSLPEIYCQALTMFYLSDMSTREIARFLGTSPNNIAQRLKRARAKLKEEMVAMISTTFEEQKLQAGFTFRIVESVKRLKIQATPRTTGLPWGLSLATGIILAILSIGSHLSVPDFMSASTEPVLSSELSVADIGEIPVDILSISRIPAISGGQGNDSSGASGLPDQSNEILLAPRKADFTFPKEPTARLGKGTLMGARQGLEGSLAYSPDEKLIAVAGGAGVWLFNAADLTEVGLLQGHTSPVSSVDFSPDGKLLASGGWMDKTVRLWDLETQEKVHVFWGQSDWVGSVKFSPDGRLIAAAGSSGDWGETAVRLLDVATKKEIAVIRKPGEWINTPSFSPDGKLLAAGSTNNVVRIWSVEEAKEIAVLEGHTGTVRSVFFNSDGSLLASAGGDGTIRLWDVEKREEITVLEGHTDGVSCISFSPDDKLLASGGRDKTVRLWDIDKQKELGALKEYDNSVWGVFFSPNGERLALGIGDSTVRLWDMAEQKETATLEGYNGDVYFVSFSPDGKLLASGGGFGDSEIRLWNMDEIEEAAPLEGFRARCVSFSPDGKMLAAGGWDNTICLWDMETKSKIAVLEGHKHSVACISFSPDGKLLASGGGYEDSTIRLWDVEKRKEIDVLEGHTDGVVCVAFSPDGGLLASGGGGYTVRLWDVKTGKENAVLRAHNRVVCGVAFSPDGNLLASGSYDWRIYLWDVEPAPPLMLRPKKPIQLAALSTQSVEALCFSPDGKYLVSGERDKLVKIWDVAEKRLVKMLNGHNTWPISSLSFSPDGKWLASGSYDGTVLLWDMNPEVSDQSVGPMGKLPSKWGEVRRTELYQNYPNPFNPETWLPFSLSESEHVKIKIHTQTGQLVRTLDLGQRPSGTYLSKEKAAYWDGRNETGEAVTSDVYFYTLEAGSFAQTRKMTVLR